ncbi:MATE efflux family protein [Legionella beliardensis]|uniref:MATE efflux family protein n=1 Tax=Legionella beliardensis TaxID=91822 RepID=A0A378I2V8_9GAMM|nr:MATE family efflux transporter [Legionella beliardensis]STX29323.1 MATE efflux family protein [Legionella beliardensis]
MATYSTPHPFKKILSTSMPIILAQLIMALTQFLSVLLISYLSPEVFAASMLIFSSQVTALTIFNSLFFCVSALVGRIVGEETNLHRVGVIFQASIILSLLLSSLVIIFFLNLEFILLFLDQPKSLITICSNYFYIFVWVVPINAVINILFQITLGVFKQKFVFILSIINLVLTIIFGYLFIFGKFGFNPMGINGLAWTFLIQSIITLVIFLAYILINKNIKNYYLFKINSLKNITASSYIILKLGIPVSLQISNELLSFFTLTIMVGWLGQQALMVNQVVMQYLFLLIIPLFGLSQSNSILVGYAWGKNRLNELRVYGNKTIILGIIYTLIIMTVFITMPKPFITIFLHNNQEITQLYEIISIVLLIVIVGQLFDGVRNIAAGGLRGLEDTTYPMLISVICIWPIGITLAYLFGFILHWGLIGITVASDISLLVAAILIFMRWRKLSTKLKNS